MRNSVKNRAPKSGLLELHTEYEWRVAVERHD
jgi:hypothetical protein